LAWGRILQGVALGRFELPVIAIARADDLRLGSA